MLATVEREVAALQRRYLADVQLHLRDAVADSGSGFFGLLRYHLGWEDADGKPVSESTGKALRPVLCLAACDLAGGDWQKALPAAVALELVHNFSLIHDDIQDQDVTRRGRPTLWSITGVAPAVAAGNAMRVIADQVAASLTSRGFTAELVVQACNELTLRYLEMIEGQYLDVSFEQADDVTTEQYVDMIGRKTGALIENAMYLGALLATGEQAKAKAFGGVGRALGVAFQIRDDYLGVWGDPGSTGKPVGSDIHRKKKSLPVVYLFEHATQADRVWLDEAYAEAEVSGLNVERVLGLLGDLGASAYVQQQAELHAQGALATAAGLGLSTEGRALLNSMAEFFVTRDK